MRKAEADFDAVLLLRRSRKPSRFDTIRFHCQQCCEKYLKAMLQESGVRFPRTHDLSALVNILHPLSPTWANLHSELAALTDAAVEFRYPNRWSVSSDAREAFGTCRRVRSRARKSLGLKLT